VSCRAETNLGFLAVVLLGSHKAVGSGYKIWEKDTAVDNNHGRRRRGKPK